MVARRTIWFCAVQADSVQPLMLTGRTPTLRSSTYSSRMPPGPSVETWLITTSGEGGAAGAGCAGSALACAAVPPSPDTPSAATINAVEAIRRRVRTDTDCLLG